MKDYHKICIDNGLLPATPHFLARASSSEAANKIYLMMGEIARNGGVDKICPDKILDICEGFYEKLAPDGKDSENNLLVISALSILMLSMYQVDQEILKAAALNFEAEKAMEELGDGKVTIQ